MGRQHATAEDSSVMEKTAALVAPAETIISIEPERTITESGEEGSDDHETEVPERRNVHVKANVQTDTLEPKKESCINEDSLSENYDTEEEVCRICQLSTEHLSEVPSLMQLGCGCKGDLAISHHRCAKVWFRRKGNRYSFKKPDLSFKMLWSKTHPLILNDVRFNAYSLESEDSSSWKRSFCNFFVACLVLAFIILWFFHSDVLGYQHLLKNYSQEKQSKNVPKKPKNASYKMCQTVRAWSELSIPIASRFF